VNDIKAMLVATDFSPGAKFAVHDAIQIAKKYGASLHVAHAIDTPIPIFTPYDVAIPPGVIEQARASAKESLEKTSAEVAAAGVTTEAHLTEGPAAVGITRLAGELGVELVVVGTHGHTGLKHLMLGSVAERTIRLAPCSVLAVKNNDA
jgi:universal stress protein A